MQVAPGIGKHRCNLRMCGEFVDWLYFTFRADLSGLDQLRFVASRYHKPTANTYSNK